MKTLSVVISAWNEESKIGRCLESVAWADEIIVVDNESSDRTPEIARKYTKNIHTRPNDPMLNKNKNFGFDKARCEYILNLDADEVVTPALAAEIREVLKNGGKNANGQEMAGYWISRKNMSFGKWIRHGLWWPDKQLRLFIRGRGRFPEKHIHEYVRVDGPVGELAEPYIHYNYESIDQYLKKLDRCTTSEAGYLVDSGYQPAWFDALRFPVSDFMKIFFAQGGYRDGLHGLVLSLLQAFYSFVTFAKLWEIRKFPPSDLTIAAISRELDHEARELSFWKFSVLASGTSDPLKSLWYRIRRKIAGIRAK